MSPQGFATLLFVCNEAGWSLAYHGGSYVGKLVRASKYENAGPFALELVTRTVEVVRTCYPIQLINGIVSVIVETFARQVADLLAIEYLPALTKTRITQPQKDLTNRLQKEDNVREAFVGSLPWPTEKLPAILSSLLQESEAVREKQHVASSPPDQLSFLVSSNE